MILKLITVISGIFVIFSACLIDTPGWFFVILFSLNFAWLAVFFWVNRDYYRRYFDV